MKKRVVIVSMADWAGSAHQVCKAVNSVGKFECRSVTLHDIGLGFEMDIVLPSGPANQFNKKASDYPQYEEVKDLLDRADLIHCWNDEPDDPDWTEADIYIPLDKVRVITFTGSHYRINHKTINFRLNNKHLGWRLTVQNPCLKFPSEISSIFIPHAVDTRFLGSFSDSERILGSKSVGVYYPFHKATSGAADIQLLSSLLAIYSPQLGWATCQDLLMKKLVWKERMDRLSGCGVYFHDMDVNVGYFGRSALEACSMGIPTFAYYSEKALAMSEGKLGSAVPVVCVDRRSYQRLIPSLLLDMNLRRELISRSKFWVEEHFSYKIIGNMYTELYEECV